MLNIQFCKYNGLKVYVQGFPQDKFCRGFSFLLTWECSFLFWAFHPFLPGQKKALSQSFRWDRTNILRCHPA